MTAQTPTRSAVAGLRRQLCPRCREGRIFRCPVYRGPLSMRDHCEVCGLKFEREPGYFLGAMYVSYGLSIPPVLLLVLLLWKYFGWPYDWSLAGACVGYLPCVPPVARFSRVVWMYLDQAVDPR